MVSIIKVTRQLVDIFDMDNKTTTRRSAQHSTATAPAATHPKQRRTVRGNERRPHWPDGVSDPYTMLRAALPADERWMVSVYGD